MQEALTEYLRWHLPLKRLHRFAKWLSSVEVYVDFDWNSEIGHPQRTFQNCKSLGAYIKGNPVTGKKQALVLTQRAGQPEGCHNDHATHQIFIVNIDRYKQVGNNDAAGAYFAGLAGVPIIKSSTSEYDFSQEQLVEILKSRDYSQAIDSWVRSNPDYITDLLTIFGDDFPLSNTPTSRLTSEISTRLDRLSSKDYEAIQLLLCSDEFPNNILSNAILAKRRIGLEEFRVELELNKWNEKQWKVFFAREDWIFGQGLLYHVLVDWEREVFVGGKDMSNKRGQVADFAAKTGGDGASFIALVDIKTPDASLVNRDPYRNRAHEITRDIAGAVAQILSNCNRWIQEGQNIEENRERSSEKKWTTAQPRGIIVAGHTSSLLNGDMKKSFELFRRHIHGVEILTFDEVYRRAEFLASPEPVPENDDFPQPP